MKIKTLGAMCKRAGDFRLYDQRNDEGSIVVQWLGDGGAIYPLHGLPRLGEEHIAAFFELTEKQLEKISIRHHEDLPAHLNFEDYDASEIWLDDREMTLAYGKYIVKPLITRDGLELINNEYMTPLADVADHLMIHARRTDGGQTYFAVKMGLMLVGLIMPLNLIEDQFVESVEGLAVKARAALIAKRERDERRKRESLSGQMELEEVALHEGGGANGSS
jgi:hypothetical protein